MIRLALVAVTLFVFWLLMSGNYKAWLVLSGAGASLVVVAFAHFKGVIDGEGFPFEKLPRALAYWPWLAVEIAKSAWNVTRIILDPKLPISPTMTRVAAKAHSSIGIVTYANSITLTPGTISVEVSEKARAVWVHAITRENAAGVADDAMNDRVAAMEGTR